MAFLWSFLSLLLIPTVLIGGTTAQTACRLDLAFVVDASGGVCDHDRAFKYATDTTCSNWNRTKNFLRDVVSRLNISASDIQVSVVTFRHKGTVQWLLSKYTDKNSLLNAIDKIPYEKGGETNIAAGLTTLRDEVFGKTGDRPDAVNRAVIITDGPEPSYTASILDIINRLHGDGVTTLSVGIANDIPKISDVVLRLLASQPKQLGVNYFETRDFFTLGEVANPLSSLLCQSGRVAAEMSSFRSGSQTACPLDLAFIVDSSGGVCDSDPNFHYETDTTCKNWNSIKRFLQDVVSRLNISTSNIQVAIVTFNDYGAIQWLLSRYTDQSSLLAAINSMPYVRGGTTNITGALTTMRNQVFGQRGDRPYAANRAVIITDGPDPSENASIQTIMNTLQGDGVTTMAVGITDQISDNVLRILASPPKQLGVSYFKTRDFSTLGELTDRLLSQFCWSVPTQPPTTGSSAPGSSTRSGSQIDCTNQMDLTFVVDSSGSICNDKGMPCDNWGEILGLIHAIVNDMNIGVNDVRCALVEFESYARIKWDLTTYHDKSALLNAIDNLEYKGGNTNTIAALDLLSIIFSEQMGDRPDVRNMAILITDGKPMFHGIPYPMHDIRAAVKKVNDQNIQLLAVGVTDSIHKDTLKELSSPPHEENENYFFSPDYKTLKENVRSQLYTKTCYTSPKSPKVTPFLSTIVTERVTPFLSTTPQKVWPTPFLSTTTLKVRSTPFLSTTPPPVIKREFGRSSRPASSNKRNLFHGFKQRQK